MRIEQSEGGEATATVVAASNAGGDSEAKPRKLAPRDSHPRIIDLESITVDGDWIEWLSARQAAKQMLGITSNAVYAWIERGFGPPVYSFYGQWRYKRHEVEAWIETRRKTMSDPLFRVISVVQASNLMGIHENTLWRWIERGKGPDVFIFNGRYVFKETEVIKWVEKTKADRISAATEGGAGTEGGADSTS